MNKEITIVTSKKQQKEANVVNNFSHTRLKPVSYREEKNKESCFKGFLNTNCEPSMLLYNY